MINDFINKWRKFCDKNKIEFKSKIDTHEPIVTLRFRKGNYVTDIMVSVLDIETMHEDILDLGILERLNELVNKAEVD